MLASPMSNQTVTHNFLRKLTTAQRNTARAPSYDFWRLNNKSSTKEARAESANIASIDDGSSTRCPKRRRPSLSGPSAMKGRHAGRPTAAATTRKGSSRAPGKSNSACRCSAGRLRGRCATGCRDAGLHGIPAGALAPDLDEQRDRAHQPRDQEEDEGRRDLPGRQLGPHAGDGEAEVHSGARVGQEEVPGHVQAGGDGRAERKGGGLKEDGADDG